MGGGGGKKVTIGYKYYLGMHLVVCHGPIDKLLRVIAGERSTGSLVTASGSTTINAPDLFGGPEKEGGIVGKVDWMFGEPTQGENAYLRSKIGANIPFFRGVFSAVLNQVYVCAMNPYPKPWWFVVQRCPARAWYPEKAEINPQASTGASANPAHIVYETLTNTDWGMGYPPTQINSDGFKAAADVLYDEGFGLSLCLSGQGTVEEFLVSVLDHINAVVYTNRQTGLFELKLIRGDYDPGTLPVFDETCVLSVEDYQRPVPAEMVNEVSIVYRPRAAWKDAAITMQDLASIQAQGGVISQKIEYPGIDDHAVAARVGMRELKQRSTPLAMVKMTVNRKGWDLDPGDPFKFSWPELGIENMVLRAVKVDYGDVLSGRIVVDAVEDIFGLPSVSYTQAVDSVWTDPVGDPVAVQAQRLIELPYYVVYRAKDPADFAAEVDASSAWVQSIAAEPQAAPNYWLWTKTAGMADFVEAAVGEWTPWVLLAEDIDETKKTGILVTSFPSSGYAVGEWALLDDEVVRIDAYDAVAGTINLGRGCLDTAPRKHLTNARLWFADDRGGFDPTEYAYGESITARLLTQTGSGTLDILQATDVQAVMVGRMNKPYPPGQFKVNASYFPAKVVGALSFAWATRNRLTQTAGLIDFESNSITPEAGETYTLALYGERDLVSTPLRTASGLSALSYSWADELTDLDTWEYAPPEADFAAPMDTGLYLRGRLRDPANPTGSGLTGVTFDGERADFPSGGGYFDCGRFNLGKSFSVLFRGYLYNWDTTAMTILSKCRDDGTAAFALQQISGYLRVILNGATQGSQHADVYGQGDGVSLVTVEVDAPGAGQVRVTVYRDGAQTDQDVYTATIGDMNGKEWSVGSRWAAGGGSRTELLKRFYLSDLRVYDRLLTAADVWPNRRLNATYRAALKSVRGGVDSFQSQDHTGERAGFGYLFGKHFGGA